MKIVLISCVSKKLSRKAKARDLYISPLFKYNLAYSEKKLRPDKIFILSAKYGLLKLGDKVEPYEKTLNGMSAQEVKAWAEKVLRQLKRVSNVEKDKFVFLAGERYRKYILPHVKRTPEVPLRGLSIGKQLSFLVRKLSDV